MFVCRTICLLSFDVLLVAKTFSFQPIVLEYHRLKLNNSNILDRLTTIYCVTFVTKKHQLITMIASITMKPDFLVFKKEKNFR